MNSNVVNFTLPAKRPNDDVAAYCRLKAENDKLKRELNLMRNQKTGSDSDIFFADPSLQDEFGDLETYLAYKKATDAGLAKIFRGNIVR